MKRMISFLIVCVCLIAPVYAEGLAGIFASVEHPGNGLIVIHEDGWMEQYADASDLPDNRMSFGYIAMMTTYEKEEDQLLTAHGIPFTLSPSPVWQDEAYAAVQSSPFFPTALQLAASGMTWENDQLGTLTFFADGRVISDAGTEGLYDNGRLTLAEKTYIVQRSVWSNEEENDFILCDQTLTLYENDHGESTDRLLLVENGDVLVLE